MFGCVVGCIQGICRPPMADCQETWFSHFPLSSSFNLKKKKSVSNMKCDMCHNNESDLHLLYSKLFCLSMTFTVDGALDKETIPTCDPYRARQNTSPSLAMMAALVPAAGQASRTLGCRGNWASQKPIRHWCWTTCVLASSFRLMGRSDVVSDDFGVVEFSSCCSK